MANALVKWIPPVISRRWFGTTAYGLDRDTHESVSIKVDSESEVPLLIKTYLHCQQCLDHKDLTQSPREVQALEIGITADGVQVWCRTCDQNVAHFRMQE